MMVGGSGSRVQMLQQQADAVLSQVDPVSATLYTVLDTQKNVRIESINAIITWATTQPTPLHVLATVDGITFIFRVSNPVSATNYYASRQSNAAQDNQVLETDERVARPFLLEGRSVKVEIRITWATTQPTPLVCRVKYAKIP